MTTLTASPCLDASAARAAQLHALERSVTDQLRSMAAVATDEVAAAHRAGVEQMLDEVRLALRLHAEGRYGTCIRCADPISPVRLEARPWATCCIRCADRFR